MTESSPSTSPGAGSGAESTADPSPGSPTDPIGGTAPSIPASDPPGRDHDGMSTLDDDLDDVTLPYRTQIMAAVSRIDEALPGTATRNLIPGDEVQSLLLDLRLLLA